MPLPSAADHDDVDFPGWVKPLLLLAAGVALSGVADFALTQAGYGNLATLAWTLGYAGTLIVIWLAWGQHVNLVGDTGVGHEDDAGKRARTDASDEGTPAETPQGDREPPKSY
jgi:hypothetical protein